MMIALMTCTTCLVPLLQGLCSSNPCRFGIEYVYIYFCEYNYTCVCVCVAKELRKTTDGDMVIAPNKPISDAMVGHAIKTWLDRYAIKMHKQ